MTTTWTRNRIRDHNNRYELRTLLPVGEVVEIKAGPVMICGPVHHLTTDGLNVIIGASQLHNAFIPLEAIDQLTYGYTTGGEVE